ncbi:MAG: DUF2125 domain-containing protein [Alphaproteobacteria bacterium]|nr:DUF2125 domain-containing protein [Alphaproteobacteria bacterium]
MPAIMAAMSVTRRYLALLLAVIGAVAAYSAYWVWIAQRAADGLEAWAESQAAQGWTVAWSRLDARGYPFRLILALQDVAAWNERVALSVERLDAVAKPWDLSHVIAEAHGVGRLQQIEGENVRHWQALWDRAMASARLSGAGEIRRLDLEMRNLKLDGPQGLALETTRLRVHGRINRGEDAERPEGTRDLALAVEGTRLPAMLHGPLGRDLALLEIATRLGGRPETGLAAWRDDGGTLDVNRLALRLGPIEAEGDATLALDKAMRPIGAGKVKLRGQDALIDLLVAQGTLREGEGRLARAALTLLAQRDADQRPYIEAPLTAQDGRLWLGPVALATLPVLDFQ